MAVYYVSPYTTTNGTGTFESPFHWATATGRLNIAAGDEVRIVGRYLTDLLTPTVYTASLTTAQQLTITDGGGLGADFAQYGIVYLPDQGTFFKINTITGNQLNCAGNTVIPWGNSTSGVNITVRKVDLTSFPSGSSSSYMIWGQGVGDGVTITDGWVADGVRVTDGTVVSLFNSTSTSAIQATDASGVVQNRSGCVVDLSNTYFMHGNSNGGNVKYRFYLSGATYNIGQIANYSSIQAIELGNSVNPFIGGSITVRHLSNFYGTSAVFAKNTTFTFNNVYMVGYDNIVFISNYDSTPGIKNCTINIGNIIARDSQRDNALISGRHSFENTFNFNGVVDIFNNLTLPLTALSRAFGRYTINFGVGFALYTNRRATTVTSWQHIFKPINEGIVGSDVYVPALNLPTGFTITSEHYSLSNATNINATGSSLTRLPSIAKISMPAPVSNTSFYPFVKTCVNRNILVDFRDGSSPVELIVGFSPQIGTTNSYPGSAIPLATTDSSVFRTAAPSIKTTLTSRDSTMFFDRDSRARKTIKIPVVSGQSYTVSGYVRNNITSFANGDVRLCIVNPIGDEVVGQDMTTASNSAWEQFTLTFTASETAEYHLVMEMYFINTGSIWLDDLTIT